VITGLDHILKRPLSDVEVEAMEAMMAGVSLLRDRRKRKKVLRRARQEARLVEVGLKKGK